MPRVSLPLLVHRVHLFFTNPLRLYHILSIVPCVSVLQVILIARGRDTFEGMEVLVCRGSSLSFKSYGLILLSYLVDFFVLLTLYLQVVRCISSSFISTNNLAGVAHHHDMINMESHVS